MVRENDKRGLKLIAQPLHKCELVHTDEAEKEVVTPDKLTIGTIDNDIAITISFDDSVLVDKMLRSLLAYVMGAQDKVIGFYDIRTIRDFLDVFSDKLPGIPLDRNVEFSIELFPGSFPVSITPYHMTPKELKELKI
ncbi:RVP_2 domain-containing protein [Gossypium australe]|uniref:RVP_2 domain-containing protein n=1 Tax=Gossypium australe TaxID=47621 RepID=A0A5B6UW63_9ROSI|nr:RVP_2 domain-containing protein [Gossypium australe]